MEQPENDNTSWLKRNWVILVAFLVMACVVGFYFFNFHHQLSDDNAKWGTFGDFVGGTLNPILSFLALVIVLKTYLSQQEELQATRKILKEQTETQKKQQFESTFFELLKMHNETLNKLQNSSNLERIVGNVLDLDGIHHLHLPKKVISISGLWKYLPLAKKELEKTYSYQHYFRTLYQLLEFIAVHSDNGIDSELNVNDIEKDDVSNNEKMYSNIVRTLLPNDVINLLAVDCFCDKEEGYCKKYKLLIERYAFFEHALFNTVYEDEKIDISLIPQVILPKTQIFKEIRGYKCQDGRHIGGYYKVQAFGIKSEPSQNQENS